MLIAKYTSKTQGLRPTFNDGYAYTVTKEKLINDIYEVELSADTDFSSVNFKEQADLLTVDYLKVTSKVTTLERLFENCKSLTMADTSNFDTSNVVNMYKMCIGCNKLVNLDVSKWTTDKLTSILYAFTDCFKLTELDVSTWNVSNVKNCHHVFTNCRKLIHLNLSKWEVKNVTATYNMFSGCSSLVSVDLSGWNMNKVTDMTDMFTNCSKLQHVGMLYCDSNTVNAIANALPTVSGLTRTIYIQDTKNDIYTPRDNIVFYDYADSRTIITLPQPLNSGDMLIWDDSLMKYILKKSDSSVIEIDTHVKYVLDVFRPYYRIETDEKESPPSSMTVKLYISKDVE